MLERVAAPVRSARHRVERAGPGRDRRGRAGPGPSGTPVVPCSRCHRVTPSAGRPRRRVSATAASVASVPSPSLRSLATAPISASSAWLTRAPAAARRVAARLRMRHSPAIRRSTRCSIHSRSVTEPGDRQQPPGREPDTPPDRPPAGSRTRSTRTSNRPASSPSRRRAMHAEGEVDRHRLVRSPVHRQHRAGVGRIRPEQPPGRHPIALGERARVAGHEPCTASSSCREPVGV